MSDFKGFGFVFLCIMAVFAPIFIGIWMHGEGRASLEQIGQVGDWVREYPKMMPHFQDAMTDDFFSENDYYRMRSVYRNLKLSEIGKE